MQNRQRQEFFKHQVVDRNIKAKIENDEYVDFSRLLSRDKVRSEDDQRMQLVSRGGMTWFVPVGVNDSGISSIGHWDQAF